MTMKRIMGAAAILCLIDAANADEIIYNGLPCNSLCQAWMGVGPEHKSEKKEVSEKTEPEAPPAPRHRTASAPSHMRDVLRFSAKVLRQTPAPKLSSQTKVDQPAPTLPPPAPAQPHLDAGSSPPGNSEKRSCPNILSHSADYDEDLVQLCQFVLISAVKR